MLSNKQVAEKEVTIFSHGYYPTELFLGEEVSDMSASLIIAQMLFLEAQDPEKDIQLYINSPGGSVSAGFAIYDTMQYIKCDVSTICIGLAASFGAFLLAGGTKRKTYRFAKRRNNDTPASNSWKWYSRTGNRYKNNIRPYTKSKETTSKTLFLAGEYWKKH